MAPPIVYRPPRAAELADCALVWYSAVDDYMARLNRPLPTPYLDPLLALLKHVQATDPARLLVAVRSGAGATAGEDKIVGFGAAVQREHVWFLSQLYVLPEEQHRGTGRAILTQILPSLDAGDAGPGDTPPGAGEPGVLATCTDSAQPISTGLYAHFGIVPRVPVFNLVGYPKPDVLPQLPQGISAVAMDHLGPRAARLASEALLGGRDAATANHSDPDLADMVDAIDRTVLGYTHRLDHAHLRASGRSGFLYLDSSGEALGYGYSSEAGRFGPVALLDETLTAPVIGHLARTIHPRGATSAWVPGANDRAMVAMLRAGLRIEGFPAQLCWTRPFGAFDRYLPASLALL
jgi:GNAT superfamily N-acetyltransferase